MSSPMPAPGHPAAKSAKRPVKALQPWHLLLLFAPFLGLLFPGLYAQADPELFGFPFFYWYQFCWVILSATLTGIVYWRIR